MPSLGMKTSHSDIPAVIARHGVIALRSHPDLVGAIRWLVRRGEIGRNRGLPLRFVRGVPTSIRLGGLDLGEPDGRIRPAAVSSSTFRTFTCDQRLFGRRGTYFCR